PQRARALRSRQRFLHPLRGSLVIEVIDRADARHSGPGEREARVLRDGVLVHLQGELEVLPRTAARVAPTPEEEVVRLQILGRARGDRLLLLRAERQAERPGDLSRDLVLNLEDVLHLAVIALDPERKIRVCIDELGADPEAVSRPAETPGENVRRAELLAD